MQEDPSKPLPYESKKDFNYRKSTVALTSGQREAIRFACWMLGLLAAGLLLILAVASFK